MDELIRAMEEFGTNGDTFLQIAEILKRQNAFIEWYKTAICDLEVEYTNAELRNILKDFIYEYPEKCKPTDATVKNATASRYKELRRLSPEDVYHLCVKKQWYTKGTNSEYSEMLAKVGNIEYSEKSITTEQIYEIAEDILAHSITDYNVEMIMWELANVSNTSFFVG